MRMQTTPSTTDFWGTLDSAALANLDASGVKRFHEYKRDLREEGYSWEDAEEILSGHIWGDLDDAADNDN